MRARCEDMSVVIAVVDYLQYKFFDTCTQRLGVSAITLEEDQTLKCTFEMDLPLAEGTFHVHANLHRYLTGAYDRWFSAATYLLQVHPRCAA